MTTKKNPQKPADKKTRIENNRRRRLVEKERRRWVKDQLNDQYLTEASTYYF